MLHWCGRLRDDNGVDADLLAEMRGDSEDDLIAQAKRLADRIKPVSPVIPGQAELPGECAAGCIRRGSR